jgi:trimethylamine--corrinoid protein Co-methyltransferase
MKLQLLEPSLVGRIVDEAIAVLETTGMLIEHPPAFDRVCATGLPGDPSTRRITFPRAEVEAALATVPDRFTLYDRAGQAHAEVGGDHVNFVPASSALRILDRKTQKHRDPQTADFVEYVKVAHHLKNLSYLSTAFIPKDVLQEIADAWRLYLCLAHSPQPVVSGAFTATGVERMARLMSFFRGGKEDLVARPLSIFTCCPNTPLRWGEDPVRNLMDCADWGIPVEIVPVLLLGMISPVTVVGALVLHTAEVLSGIVIAQKVRPGTPILFGGAPAAFHMQYMTNPMTSAEAYQVFAGYTQIADHLKLPSQGYLALSDSKFNDLQAGAESAMGAMLATLCNMHSVSGPGMLDYVNSFSLEKLVFDDELIAQIRHFRRPIAVKEDLPTRDLIAELIENNHLLTAEHTLNYWPEELYLPAEPWDRTNWDQWQQQGNRDLRQRALERIDQALADYEEEPLAEALHSDIRELLVKTCSQPDVQLPALDS